MDWVTRAHHLAARRGSVSFAAQRAGDSSELQAFDGDHSAVIDTSSQGWELCLEALARLL